MLLGITAETDALNPSYGGLNNLGARSLLSHRADYDKNTRNMYKITAQGVKRGFPRGIKFTLSVSGVLMADSVGEEAAAPPVDDEDAAEEQNACVITCRQSERKEKREKKAL